MYRKMVAIIEKAHDITCIAEYARRFELPPKREIRGEEHWSMTRSAFIDI